MLIVMNNFPTLSSLFKLVGIYLGVLLPLALLAAWSWQGEGDWYDSPWLSSLLYALPLAAAVYYAYHRSGRPRLFRSTRRISFGTVVVAWFFVLFSVGAVLRLMSLVPGYDEFVALTEEYIGNSWSMGLTAVLIAPLLEEILFRGLILEGLLRRMSPARAIGLSALAFGLFHLHPIHIVAAGAMGLALGYIYYRTRALWLVILLHAINNLAAWSQSGAESAPEPWMEHPLALLLSLAFLVSMAWVCLRSLQRRTAIVKAAPPAENLTRTDRGGGVAVATETTAAGPVPAAGGDGA